MNQNDISIPLRLTPAILAAVLLIVTLSFLTLRVHAQEGGENSVVQQPGENVEERRALLEEQKTERQEMSEEGDFTEEERRQLQQDQREEMEIMMGDEQDEEGGVPTEQQGAHDVDFEARANELREKAEARKEERQQRMQEHRAKLSLQAQARLGQYTERITTRMNTAIERLTHIANRTLARIEMLEEKGADLSDARNEIEKAYTALEASETFVALFAEVSTEAYTSENPGAQAQEVRDAAKLAKDSLKAVHTALVETVQLIKVGVIALEEEVESEESEEEVEEDVATETDETTE
jgi:hypothetical protein